MAAAQMLSLDMLHYTPELILRINGGIGNQLFQYAFGECYRHATGVPVVYETLTLTDWFFDLFGGTRRGFELPSFGLNPACVADNVVNRAVFVDRSTLFRRVVGNMAIKLWGVDLGPHYLWESRNPYVFYEDAFQPVKRPTFMSGYFQSYRYFEAIASHIRAAYDVANVALTPSSSDLLTRIKQSAMPVALHVRRGDYLKFTDTFHICKPDYYRRAIEVIEQKCQGRDITYFVFSDDVDYVKSIFKDGNFCFAEDAPGKGSHEDLCLMAQCHHNVIANSSYSWWGAWLNGHDDKVVIAPESWSVNLSADSELLPKEWIKL